MCGFNCWGHWEVSLCVHTLPSKADRIGYTCMPSRQSCCKGGGGGGLQCTCSRTHTCICSIHVNVVNPPICSVHVPICNVYIYMYIHVILPICICSVYAVCRYLCMYMYIYPYVCSVYTCAYTCTCTCTSN